MNSLFDDVPHFSVGETGDKIISPFGPLIYQSFLSDLDIRELLEEGSRLTKESNDHNFALAGNFKKGRSLAYSDEFRERYSPVIMEKVFNFLSIASGNISFSVPSVESLSLRSLWINYQKQYDFNPMHSHSGLLSFVIYCSVPDAIFEDRADSNFSQAGNVCFYYGESMTPLSIQNLTIRPRNNLMFVFPAGLNHLVYPFFADETRISVSGNIA